MSTHLRPRASARPFRHAVVLGGSVAGLLAARVLADHFERVTLVERDRWSDAPEPRKGVPQGNHVHALLVRGRLIMEKLLPGLTEELVAAGAILVNAGRDVVWHHAGGWRVQHDSDLVFLSMTRPLLESAIAGRVRTIPNLTARDGVRLVGLSADGRGVVGVRIAGGGAVEEIEADLVVDATGRGSATPRHLTELGFDAPKEELIGARVGYVTCAFRRPDSSTDARHRRDGSARPPHRLSVPDRGRSDIGHSERLFRRADAA
jgi:2-polyprenyl-6-methoxyphenol hydroxylase-like FAD-dependent oxidoreductase